LKSGWHILSRKLTVEWKFIADQISISRLQKSQSVTGRGYKSKSKRYANKKSLKISQKQLSRCSIVGFATRHWAI